MVKRVLVLGGGSAGFLAAISLKSKIPSLDVSVIRSREIAIIGVGEGSTTSVAEHLFQFCNIHPGPFYAAVEPVWKLGGRFIWGHRDHFDLAFNDQLDTQINGFSRSTGFYYDAIPNTEMGIDSTLMSHNKVFVRGPDGRPAGDPARLAMHLENEKFVAFLETYATKLGVPILEETIRQALQDERGVAGLLTASGQTLTADLYIDCSGFVSFLLGKTLGEPFVSFKNSLFCDRAVIGGWARTDEPIRPYTTNETMDAGWCWKIEHEHRINRGYVYASDFVSDEQAEREFRQKNPKLGPTRVVKYVGGRYERPWVKNVVAIGNAAGFVEPLQATALAVMCHNMQWLTWTLMDAEGETRPTQVKMFNRAAQDLWENLRGFLSIHYKFNKRLNTPFWQACWEKTDLGNAAALVEYYQENGPSTVWKPMLVGVVNVFRFEGWLSMLLGQSVPHRSKFRPTPQETERWHQFQRYAANLAARAYSVPEAFKLIRSPNWIWPGRGS